MGLFNETSNRIVVSLHIKRIKCSQLISKCNRFFLENFTSSTQISEFSVFMHAALHKITSKAAG
jgi:hypothetical protein